MQGITKVGIAVGATGVLAAGGALAWALRDVGWRPAPGSGTDPQLANDRRALEAAFDVLETSPIGARVVEGLADDGARITIVDDVVFRVSRHKTQAAQYQPWNDEIIVRRGRTMDPQRLALTIAHEAFHRDRRWRDSAATLGSGVAGAWRGAIDLLPGGSTNGSIGAGASAGFFDAIRSLETDAYAFQAALAAELGIQDRGIGTNPDGSRATSTQTRERLDRSPTYTQLPERPAGPEPSSADAENSFRVREDGVEHIPWMDSERGLRQRVEASRLDD